MVSKPADKEKWEKQQTLDQYELCWNKDTEPPFSGEYNDCKDEGICWGGNLFSSDTKFESGTGWPSFWSPVKVGSVKEETDKSYGMVRTEVICAKCSAHLGHMFDDDPNPTGLRYRINSLSLSLAKGACDR
jgi:peptide-methionine (R)-S-oxide reductase